MTSLGRFGGTAFVLAVVDDATTEAATAVLTTDGEARTGLFTDNPQLST